MAAHTQRRSAHPALCIHPHHVCSVFACTCSFAGLIRRMLPWTFSDTAIIDRHIDATIFQLRAHWVQISWSIGSAILFRHVPPVDGKHLLEQLHFNTVDPHYLDFGYLE